VLNDVDVTVNVIVHILQTQTVNLSMKPSNMMVYIYLAIISHHVTRRETRETTPVTVITATDWNGDKKLRLFQYKGSFSSWHPPITHSEAYQPRGPRFRTHFMATEGVWRP
jgi:hypothetical protein